MELIRFIKNCQEYFEDFVTRSTNHSNCIEGSTLSMAETYAIIFNQKNIKINAEPRDFYEAINHKYAIDYIFKNIDNTLTESMIIAIATLVNKTINEIDGYRTQQVFIRGAEHIPPTPQSIRQQMMYFVHNYNNTQYLSIFEKVAANHITFERIHPFSDGNGRTGRLLICYELIKNNVAPAIINKQNKAEYLKYIETQDIKSFANFLAELSSQENERVKKFVNAYNLNNEHAEIDVDYDIV